MLTHTNKAQTFLVYEYLVSEDLPDYLFFQISTEKAHADA